jgi:hypothetical protein
MYAPQEEIVLLLDTLQMLMALVGTLAYLKRKIFFSL